MQPEKVKKKLGLSLLDRLRLKHPVNLGMELQGYLGMYLLEGTIDKKILVSFNDEFLGSALTINQALEIIGSMERKNVSDYDKSSIETTYVLEDEAIETKIREELMPKKLTKANGIKIYDKRFYIVKKKPNGTSSGKIFCLYNWDTRNLIFAHWDKDLITWFLGSRYKLIEHKDI